MHRVVVLLGGNIGNVVKHFDEASKLLQEIVGDCIKQSSIYESPAWGFEHESNFLNQVLIFETEQSSHTCLAYCLEIELKLGRKRNGSTSLLNEGVPKYQARTIDIDILFYDSEIIDTEVLTVPHSQIQYRRFTLMPLVEIIPEFVHPVLQKTNSELLEVCEDGSEVMQL